MSNRHGSASGVCSVARGGTIRSILGGTRIGGRAIRRLPRPIGRLHHLPLPQMLTTVSLGSFEYATDAILPDLVLTYCEERHQRSNSVVEDGPSVLEVEEDVLGDTQVFDEAPVLPVDRPQYILRPSTPRPMVPL